MVNEKVSHAFRVFLFKFNNSLSVVGIKTEAKKRYLAARSIQPKDVSAVPARVSKRQRGIAPEKTVGDKAELPVMIIPREIRSIATQSPQISSLPLNTCLPLTLASIGVTIWELGTFVEGEERGAYWSSAGVRPLDECS